MTNLVLALINVSFVAYWLPESLPVNPVSSFQSDNPQWSVSRFYSSLKRLSTTVASPIAMLTPERSGREPYTMILGIVVFLFALDNAKVYASAYSLAYSSVSILNNTQQDYSQGRDDAQYGFLQYIQLPAQVLPPICIAHRSLTRPKS